MSAQSAASAPADGVIRAAAELGLLPLEGQDLQAVLERVAHLSLAVVPGSGGASCTLLRDGRRHAAGYTAPCVEYLEKLWYDAGFGPGAQALERARPVTSGDLHAEYGTLGDSEVEPGVISVVALPLFSGGLGETAAGVLTLFAPARDAFAGFQRTLIEPFLSQAAVTLRNAQAYGSATGLVEQLREALASRAVIEQAKGAIMARRRVTPEEAFELLRRSSQRRNVKLRDVAGEVVASTAPSAPSAPPGGGKGG